MTGWLVAALMLAPVPVTARLVFARIRPHRAAVCGLRKGDPEPGYMRGAHYHVIDCYRRKWRDLSPIHVDRDVSAAIWAVLAAVLWPLVAGYVLLGWRVPETDPERKVRLRRLADRNRELEAENEQLRSRAEAS